MEWYLAPLGNTAQRTPFPSAAPSELLSGSVIFWQQRLTALPLCSGLSSPLSGLLRSFPAGVCGTDRWQINDNGERLPQWETPRNAAVDSVLTSACLHLGCVNKDVTMRGSVFWHFSGYGCFFFVYTDGKWNTHTHTHTRTTNPPMGQAHKLDLLLALTHFNMVSLERDAASTGTHPFLLSRSDTHTHDWLALI